MNNLSKQITSEQITSIIKYIGIITILIVGTILVVESFYFDGLFQL